MTLHGPWTMSGPPSDIGYLLNLRVSFAALANRTRGKSTVSGIWSRLLAFMTASAVFPSDETPRRETTPSAVVRSGL
jgi:hypothetical protein